MEIPSYTSNIQPYGSQSGIKFASENDGATRASSKQNEVNRTEQLRNRQNQSVEAAIELAQQREQINKSERAKMVEQMNEFISSINKDLAFRVDEESGRDVVTIYEASTGDIIRQIPNEEMLEVLRRLARQKDHSTGLLVAKV
ncbi:flagellar protein FlaG [Vibrio anguillarum]|nr:MULTISPECIES: flagellar protein FlaG [Vibrio]NCO45325.1 flagellar protein FlaG [Vibrio sp.]OXX69765.1 flagellar biosynthesis protein FlaG [Vibrio sp. V03_P4A6T147]AEH32610.1 FlaG [Vibrio anguillarum 775]AGU57174.1 flagellar protein FlaG [Vibrio anguillarum M3]AQM19079.1 flagellar biosynthesis protein FlaG [Vibrio anguillarum]